jgi:hypothetical protein
MLAEQALQLQLHFFADRGSADAGKVNFATTILETNQESAGTGKVNFATTDRQRTLCNYWQNKFYRSNLKSRSRACNYEQSTLCDCRQEFYKFNFAKLEFWRKKYVCKNYY